MVDNEQVEEILLILDDKLSKTVSVLKEEYSSVRAGRANPHVLDKVSVDYYGVMTPVTQTASVSVQEGRCLVIAPWDVSILKSIEKAIQVSSIGITPTNDGKVIRLVFPDLTEREEESFPNRLKRRARIPKWRCATAAGTLWTPSKNLKTIKCFRRTKPHSAKRTWKKPCRTQFPK